jgi:hypothetical protein
VENIAYDSKYVFHFIVGDNHRLNSILVHHDGFGSKEKNGSKRNSPKPAPSAADYTFFALPLMFYYVFS